ncbi:acyltransferase family protein [Larsenimonas rhizosphaerae]|uniref:Acyltransferase n=1 Tax=Larsenimonas rhizosphaerae TaxID=2944682 RepID=A0AA42CUR6_9GAMM|nr:acyltransferase [Larsenimonas rhizosphaerae]MCM2131711.1 acyltransferase [Larsenimonas rhizosphaerae]MCX2524962.1 acyltransferase [Larsenimonas rhizosphaerae]
MLISVQGLRAFAAWLVVFHHFMQVFFDFNATTTTGHLLSTRGQAGVDIFFVISGFVIYISTAGREMASHTFLIHRLARVVPAYWLYTLITAGIITFAGEVMPVYGVSMRELLYSLFFLPSQNPGGFGLYPILPVGWSLNFEMLFYVIFALSFVAGERYRLWLVAGLLAVMCPLLAQQPFISNFYTNPMMYEFILGIGIGVIYRRGYIPQGRWIPLMLAVLAVAFMLKFDDQSPYRLVTWGVPGALLVGCAISLEAHFQRLPLLKQLGDWSYSVYLVHIIVLWSGEYLLTRQLDISPAMTLLACLPVILGLSWLSFEVIEKRLSRMIRRCLA